MAKRICSVDGCKNICEGRGFCSGHYQRIAKYGDAQPDKPLRTFVPRSASTEDRFWAKVEKSDDGCWLWTGYIKPNGYANFAPGGGRGVPKPYVHRYSYELARGPIPDEMEIDHSCSVRHCVNPAHLEAVTRSVNIDRRNIANGWTPLSEQGPKPPKTHCKHGHAFDEENTYWQPDGAGRSCKACRRKRTADSAARRRARTRGAR